MNLWLIIKAKNELNFVHDSLGSSVKKEHEWFVDGSHGDVYSVLHAQRQEQRNDTRCCHQQDKLGY